MKVCNKDFGRFTGLQVGTIIHNYLLFRYLYYTKSPPAGVPGAIKIKNYKLQLLTTYHLPAYQTAQKTAWQNSLTLQNLLVEQGLQF